MASCFICTVFDRDLLHIQVAFVVGLIESSYLCVQYSSVFCVYDMEGVWAL